MNSTSEAQSDTHMPNHIAVALDGNGRWAQAQGLPRYKGHQAGAKTLTEIILRCAELDVRSLTTFYLSRQNMARCESEIRHLIDIGCDFFQKNVHLFHAHDVRLKIAGEHRIDPKLAEVMDEAAKLTANNTGMTVYLCTNYGGRWDIVRVARGLAADVRAGRMCPEDISEETFSARLSMHEAGPVDLFIRTGARQRISDFLGWELAYAELYFTDVLWPDFGTAEFDRAIDDYQQRVRTFGMLTKRTDPIELADQRAATVRGNKPL